MHTVEMRRCSVAAQVAAHQIPVEHPVGVKVMDPIQNLVEQRLDHPSGELHGLLVGLRRPVEFDDML